MHHKPRHAEERPTGASRSTQARRRSEMVSADEPSCGKGIYSAMIASRRLGIWGAAGAAPTRSAASEIWGAYGLRELPQPAGDVFRNGAAPRRPAVSVGE